jgi:hypothetical protein
MVKPATEILCRFFLPLAGTERRCRQRDYLEDPMNSDAVLSSTYHRGASAKRLILFAVLLANLLYSTLAFAQILGTGQLNVERRSHTATLLENGRVLIVGGDNQTGMVNHAEIFDPVSQTSALAAALITPRTDHSATRLSDGRLLVIGGRDQTASLQSTEAYNPTTTSFVAGPAMMRARSGHSATMLSNGKILVTGGDLFGSAEIYDPATQSFSLVMGSLNTARKFHSAVLLQNGQVMIVGGINLQDVLLNTAEVFDPASQTFYLPPTEMQTARAFATLKLLSDGKVQIIGGDAELSMEVLDPTTGIFNAKALLPPNADLLGATLSTQSRAALFSLSISQDPLLQGVLTTEQLALLDRADQSITELPSLNQALVAGGVNSAGQVLNSAKLVKSSSASITTDKNDYAPGQIVTITGSGFQPNEQVDIYFHEFPEEYPDIFLSAVANQQGNFVVAEFAPQEIDVGRVFTLTAIGKSSGFTAQTAFKDNKNLTVTKGGTGSGTITSSPSGASGPANGTSINCNVSCSSQTLAFDDNQPVTLTATAANGSNFAGWSVAGGASNLSAGCTSAAMTCQFNMNNKAITVTATFNAVVATSLTVSSSSGIYRGTVNLSATLTRASNSTAVSAKTITFTLNGATAGTAITNGSGVATLAGVSLSGINAGTYSNGVGASFAGDSGFQASNGTNTLTVNKKDATWTTNAASKIYGDADPTPLTTGIGSGFLPADGVSATYARVAGETVVGSPYHITAMLSPAGVLGNYNITNDGAEFTINKRNATWTTNAASKTYGDTDPIPLTTGSGTGFLPTDGVSASYSRAAGENVSPPSYHIIATLSATVSGALNNYNITNTGAEFTINKRNATWTTNPNSKIYGDSDPNPLTTGSGNGFLVSDNVTATYSRGAGETVAESPYQITATLSPAGVLANYNITNNGAEFTINKRPASVTPTAASKIYGDADPALSGTLVGFLSADGVTASYSRTAGETVGTYTISGVLSPAGVLGNYEITYNTALFTINKRPVSVTPNAASKIYGDADPTLGGTVNGFLAADGVTATYSRTAGETVVGSPYTISAVLSPAAVLGNYDVTYNTAVFTIKKRAITITVDAKSKIYGEADPALTYQVTSGSLAFSDAFMGVLSRVAGELVGTYAIQQNTLSINNIGNYNLAYVGAQLTITTGFAFNGFYSPIGGSVENGNGGSYANPLKTFKLGSTIPVQFGATWLNGGAALITGIHTLQAVKYSNAIDSDPPIDATPTDAATDGNHFRLTSTDWHFNLSTKGSGFSAGTWLLIATLQDGSKHSVWITIKK